MRVYVELAAPESSSEPTPIVDETDRTQALGRFVGGNPLLASWTLPPPTDGDAEVIVAWSGTLAYGLFAAHPHTWLPPGRETLDGRCAVLAPALTARGATLCLRPHCRHVLSDGPSCLRFLETHADGPFGLALDPARLLEPSMLGEVVDHLERILSQLASRASIVFLHDVVPEADAGGCRVVPLGQGVLPREAVVTLVREHVDPGTPIVVADEALEAQCAWLDSL